MSLTALGQFFARIFGRNPAPVSARIASSTCDTAAPSADTAVDADLVTRFDAPAGHLVPYDENLLERARTQWQFGDWDSLANLDRDTLQHHPDRAKLALLAAAGRQQTGDMVQARHYTRLAQDWGVSKKLVSQILISGVHNSLGRAAALAGQSQRALKHFEGAIQTGAPGSESRLISQARTGNQLQQLGLPGNEFALQLTVASAGQPIAVKSPIVVALDQVRKSLDSSLKKEISNATQQLEAFLDLQSFFKTGEHLPTMHGWPISPDFARYLIQLLEKNDYDLILEFGSGTSTVLIAKALAKLQRTRQGKPAVVQVAFEHMEKYHAQTLADLKNAGLDAAVQLNLAPLQPYQAPNGQTYSYYACQQTLADLAASLPAVPKKILMVVDGPPARTGKHARYPCLPAVLAHFKQQHLDILLDDYARADEKAVGALWEQELKQTIYQVASEQINMEKDALLVTAIPQ